MASRVLVLTGGPGAGKTTLARELAQRRQRCAVIDVDDVRHMLCHPHVAPWGGEEGRRQQLLGARNACALARNFLEDGCDVVIADVLDGRTVSTYREELAPVVVLLSVDEAIALDRARGRGMYLDRTEFAALHADQARFDGYDHRLDASAEPQELVEALRRLLDAEV